MARRQKGSPSGSAPATWITTYGDMMSLLLTFFILLFALSTINEAKFRLARASLAAAFGGIFTENTTVVGEATPPTQQQLEAALQELERQDFAQFEDVRQAVQNYVAREGLATQIEVSEDSRGLIIRFADSVLFDLGKADLRPDARSILDKVIAVIKPLPNHIRVEGHTDDLKINTERFPSNWELSAGRSSAVARYFIDRHGMPPTRLSIAGYGEYRPIAPNDSESNRRRNRRVDIVILRLSTGRNEPKAGGAW
ncbi:MAG: flagellar motor protein MotB [Firmicutes bacterium]|nr:flagellar motor protein MotB [Bacillota bacterium]